MVSCNVHQSVHNLCERKYARNRDANCPMSMNEKLLYDFVIWLGLTEQTEFGSTLENMTGVELFGLVQHQKIQIPFTLLAI